MVSITFSDKIFAKLHGDTWQDCVDLAGKIWLDGSYCTLDYIQLLKDQMIAYNAYMVIVPGLALLHAESGKGVLKNSMLLITLDQPVCFGNPDNDPVTTMICFTATDEKLHLKSIKRIGTLLMEDDFLPAVQACKTTPELEAVVLDFEKRLHIKP